MATAAANYNPAPFNSIPRVSTLINQQLISPPPAPAVGATVLIVGQALDGPVGVVQSIQNLTNLPAAYGPLLYNSTYPSPDGDPGKIGTFSGNNLLKAANEVMTGGATSILLCRVGGHYAYATSGGAATGMFLGAVSGLAIFPGFIYNGATIYYQVQAATGVTVTLTPPASKGPSFTKTWSNLATFEQVAADLNDDPRNIAFQFIPQTTAITGTAAQAGYAAAASGGITLTLLGGTNGTLRDDYTGYSKQGLYNAITASGTIFDQIRGSSADFLYVAGIYADDDVSGGSNSSQSFLIDLATFCYTETRDNYPILGIIGVRPAVATDRVSIQTRVNNFMTVQSGYINPYSSQLAMAQFIQNGIPFSDQTLPAAETIDVGAFVALHVGPDLVYNDPTLGTYVDNPASMYTGLLCTLPPQRAATNYPYPSTVRVAYQYTKPQINLLNAGIGFNSTNLNAAGGAYTTLLYRSWTPGNPNLTTTEDVNCAARTNAYTNLQTSRIEAAVQAVVEYVGGLFIGQPNNTSTITALDSQLQSGLDQLAQAGLLLGTRGVGYQYQIGSQLNTVGTLGILSITMTIRPAFQIKVITFTVNVSQ